MKLTNDPLALAEATPSAAEMRAIADKEAARMGSRVRRAQRDRADAEIVAVLAAERNTPTCHCGAPATHVLVSPTDATFGTPGDTFCAACIEASGAGYDPIISADAAIRRAARQNLTATLADPQWVEDDWTGVDGVTRTGKRRVVATTDRRSGATCLPMTDAEALALIRRVAIRAERGERRYGVELPPCDGPQPVAVAAATDVLAQRVNPAPRPLIAGAYPLALADAVAATETERAMISCIPVPAWPLRRWVAERSATVAKDSPLVRAMYRAASSAIKREAYALLRADELPERPSDAALIRDADAEPDPEYGADDPRVVADTLRRVASRRAGSVVETAVMLAATDDEKGRTSTERSKLRRGLRHIAASVGVPDLDAATPEQRKAGADALASLLGVADAGAADPSPRANVVAAEHRGTLPGAIVRRVIVAPLTERTVTDTRTVTVQAEPARIIRLASGDDAPEGSERLASVKTPGAAGHPCFAEPTTTPEPFRRDRTMMLTLAHDARRRRREAGERAAAAQNRRNAPQRASLTVWDGPTDPDPIAAAEHYCTVAWALAPYGSSAPHLHVIGVAAAEAWLAAQWERAQTLNADPEGE